MMDAPVQPELSIERAPETETVALVIEDDPSLRAFLREILEANGWAVREALDGLMAIEAARALRGEGRRLALVLSDVFLPTGDVFRILPGLQEVAPQAPVVLMTSFPTEEVFDRSRVAGVRAMLSKPFDVDALLGLADEARHG